MKTKKVYQEAFDKMESVFSSHKFIAACKELGATNEEFENTNDPIDFLKKRCSQNKFRGKIWTKKDKYKTVERIPNEIELYATPWSKDEILLDFNKSLKNLSSEAMIDELKSRGYKIQKQEWTEL